MTPIKMAASTRKNARRFAAPCRPGAPNGLRPKPPSECADRAPGTARVDASAPRGVRPKGRRAVRDRGLGRVNGVGAELPWLPKVAAADQVALESAAHGLSTSAYNTNAANGANAPNVHSEVPNAKDRAGAGSGVNPRTPVACGPNAAGLARKLHRATERNDLAARGNEPRLAVRCGGDKPCDARLRKTCSWMPHRNPSAGASPNEGLRSCGMFSESLACRLTAGRDVG